MGNVVSLHEEDENFALYCDLIAYEKECVDDARKWLSDENMQAEAITISGIVDEFLSIANYDLPEKEMLVVHMQSIETQISEWTSSNKVEVIKILSQKLGFEATLKEME